MDGIERTDLLEKRRGGEVEESRAIWARFVGKEYEIMPVDTQEMKAVEDMKAAVLQVQSPMRRLEDTFRKRREL